MISPEAIAALTAYRWPGNVRELENTIERLVVFSRGRIEVPGSAGRDSSRRRRSRSGCSRICRTLDELERRYLLHVLEAVGGNRSRAAEVARHRSPHALSHG